jgi:hypothetical protein
VSERVYGDIEWRRRIIDYKKLFIYLSSVSYLYLKICIYDGDDDNYVSLSVKEPIHTFMDTTISYLSYIL